jgi:hypothetical protein
MDETKHKVAFIMGCMLFNISNQMFNSILNLLRKHVDYPFIIIMHNFQSSTFVLCYFIGFRSFSEVEKHNLILYKKKINMKTINKWKFFKCPSPPFSRFELKNYGLFSQNKTPNIKM